MMMMMTMTTSTKLPLILLFALLLQRIFIVDAFSLTTTRHSSNYIQLFATNKNDNNNNDDDDDDTTLPGDKVRSANNIRPSLNPTVINTISNALLQRSMTKSSFIIDNQQKQQQQQQPIDIMKEAAALATQAIQQRAKSSTSVKGDESSAFNVEESKLIVGRVVGVCMRLDTLEQELRDKVQNVKWVMKYGEYASFGLCKEELLMVGQDDVSNDTNDTNVSSDSRDQVLTQLGNDPLLRMCRAECLYALFIRNVEMPTMMKLGQIPVDTANFDGNGSGIDFLDKERMEVLFPNGFE